MEYASVHHIECYVCDGEKLLRTLTSQYNFYLIGKRFCEYAKQWVLKSGHAIFLITQPIIFKGNKTSDICGIKSGLNDTYVLSGQNLNFDSKNKTLSQDDVMIDTVCNVALKVKSVSACVERVLKTGGNVLKPPTKVSDKHGSVDIAIVKSCVGNVVHTLVQNDCYHGEFLPQFDYETVNSQYDIDKPNITHFDHVTFACTTGTSSEVLQWYEDVLGMRRFLMNRDEDHDEGFVIDTSDIGLRLKAMDYWYCAEVGLTSPAPSSQISPIKFVVAEALPNQGPNQVDTFLIEHGGPGIQHVGLHTPDIVQTVSCLKNAGVHFAEPPFTYYTEIGKLKDINDIGEDVDTLKSNGILVDAEADHCDGDSPSEKRYLLQKFTKPVFDRNTFFLEVIHRAGAKGFGSGNITALWRSVQAYQEHQNDKGASNS